MANGSKVIPEQRNARNILFTTKAGDSLYLTSRFPFSRGTWLTVLNVVESVVPNLGETQWHRRWRRPVYWLGGRR